MRTKAFKDAVAETLAELARREVTLSPSTVADTIEQHITTVSERLGIQVRSAWRYFDAATTADGLAQSLSSYQESSTEKGVGRAPMPPVGNPQLALVLAGLPDSLAQSGGDLYAVIVNVAFNTWMAGHIHGEDGCNGCGDRGPAGHDWNTRMDAITEMQPNISVGPGDRHGAGTRLVLGLGCNAPLEGPGRGLRSLRGGLLFPREGGGAELFQALALPVRQLVPHRVLALFVKPPADVHPVHGDARLQVSGPALFHEHFPHGRVVALPVSLTLEGGLVGVCGGG